METAEVSEEEPVKETAGETVIEGEPADTDSAPDAESEPDTQPDAEPDDEGTSTGVLVALGVLVAGAAAAGGFIFMRRREL
jgi:hypothetical protein